MANVVTVATLTKDRETISKRLISFQTTILAWAPTVPLNEIKQMGTRLLRYEDRLENLFTETSQKCSASDFTAQHQADFDTNFASLNSLRVKVADIQQQREVAANISAPSFKLERVKIPPFSGKFSEWQSFEDLFSSSVHNNNTIPLVEKMIHLKTCLVGEASSIISSFPTTGASYQQAWDLVKARYSNKREIVFAHIRKFDELKCMKEESSSGLRGIADVINETVRSLKVIGVPVEHWDLVLIYYSLKKLDLESRKFWHLGQANTDLPKLDEFITFLENRARALADSTSSGKSKSSQSNLDSSHKKSLHATTGSSSSNIKCPNCSESHNLHKCKSFLELSVVERKQLVDRKKLCFNCLFKGHLVPKCPMNFSCRTCGKRHHFLLHEDTKSSSPSLPPPPVPLNSTQQSTSQGVPPNASGDTPSIVGHCSPLQSRSNVVLLGTLIGQVEDNFGKKQNCRVFLDPGSESHFISENCVDRLGLRRKKTCVAIKGIGDSSGECATGLVNIRLFSKVYDYFIDINALILRKLTGLLPRIQTKSTWSHLEDLNLADPTFYKPGPVDILLGAQVAGSIMLPEIKRGKVNSPIAQHTQFGWILSGEVPASVSAMNSHVVTSNHASCLINNECIEETFKKFWELEEPETEVLPKSDEDMICENHFKTTHHREADGRYHVELPFKTDHAPLGSSRQGAVQRFSQVERRLSRDPLIKEEYINCMRENISSSFMELVPLTEIDKTQEESYYLPHREVVKESSSTTKVRIVFDASAKTSSGSSLNDILMTGPTLQVDLVQLLIRFRTYQVAMSADIVKFYPQFGVNKKHVDFQRLVWRESPDVPLQDYRMVRLTFGTTPAPFLAIRCLHQLAEDECKSLPQIETIIKNDFLVDNLLTGASTVEEALIIQQHIQNVMQAGQLKLRQWSSNKSELLESIPPDERECEPLHIPEEEHIKTIGILWNPGTDSFGIKIVLPPTVEPITKRKVLSSIARIFDPLGWLSPVTIRPKILMQEIWKAKLDWDVPLPPTLLKQWTSYVKDLELLKSFKLERCVTTPHHSSSNNKCRYEIHGFCDASQLAYSACVYIKTVDEDGLGKVNLVMSKTKVAPVKVETIPRLELCGGELLVKLMKIVKDSSKLSFSHMHCWTDNTAIMDWLSSDKKLPVFVSNRVRKIVSLFPRSVWSWVPGDENPADCASRGISSSSLLNHNLWYHGPAWLASSSFDIQEEITFNATEAIVPPISSFINKCSSYSRMRRVIARCIRFTQYCRVPKEERIYSQIQLKDLQQAMVHIIRSVQLESFKEEISRCKKEQVVKSSIKFLAPFLDKDDILRVGGRLKNSGLPPNQLHPILLPRNHNFTEVLVRYYHLSHLHAPPQLLLGIVREQFWIVRGPDVVRQCVRRCILCHRHNSRKSSQIMGQLPTPRVKPSRPFSQTGMDFAGPFLLCVRPGRNPKILKSYVCVFVCMCTRAIHLEHVGDLTTASFMAALSRFVYRRGRPSDLYCDGGRNFVGAANEIKEVVKFMESKTHVNAISDFCVEGGTNFHFNPPNAPHHGGLWEAGVKSMKHHLKRVIEDRKLSIEEFNTLLCHVEASLNSRPITPLSSDPNDFHVLTPGHFRTGGSLSAIPSYDITHLNSNRLSRWQLVEQMSQHFWRRWTSEYLKTLQSRPKWFAPQPNLAPGILVLIIDDDITWGPQKWKLGRIVKVYPGTDGKVRVCDVKTGGGSILKRPVVKLSPLPIYENSS